MAENAYVLNVYNTTTGEFEMIEVTEEVFNTFRRTQWNIKKGNRSFYDHEIQMSCLIGGEDDSFENFCEFNDRSTDPQEAMLEEMVHRSLHNILDMLPPDDYELIYSLYFKGMTEKAFAIRKGVAQQTIHNKKTRILKKIKNFLDDGCC